MPAGKKPNRREKTDRRKADYRAELERQTGGHKNRRLLAQVHHEVREQIGPRINMDPAAAITEILDNLMVMYRYAMEQVAALPEEEYFRSAMGGHIPHEWVREQERLALQTVHVAGKAVAMGLAERQVILQEQQAALFSHVVEAAMVKFGLDMDTRRQLHAAIADRLEDLAKGTAVELNP